jgi:HlyD family secretion protein
VRAPVEGTVLSQPVTAGQVISSATSSVSGGTSIITMADLRRIRMRAMVAETDLGQVQPGQVASVTVDAYPDRTFQGTVEKIEPQAVVEQSVTNFPVLISLSNDDQKLLPGMNGEVSLIVDQRSNVVAVPVDAVRSLKEAAGDRARVRPRARLAARAADALRPRRRARPRGGGQPWRQLGAVRPATVRRRGVGTGARERIHRQRVAGITGVAAAVATRAEARVAAASVAVAGIASLAWVAVSAAEAAGWPAAGRGRAHARTARRWCS